MLLKRLIFFGGKGGVGKSTLSCAVALRLSKEDKSLLVSIDPAHSLSGILGMPIGPEAQKIRENLHALELSAERLVEEYTERVLRNLEDLLPHVRSGLKEYAKYLKHSPTALETAILDHLLDLCQDYAYVIVDSAPTGQMLRLFETAHMVKGWFDFLTRLAKEREKVQAFMGKRDSLLSLIEERKSRVERLLDILREKSLVFAVANEEPLSLEEAQEIKRSLRDMRVYIVLNRWRSMEGDFIKVQEVERPYGIEALESLMVEGIVGIVKSG